MGPGHEEEGHLLLRSQFPRPHVHQAHHQRLYSGAQHVRQHTLAVPPAQLELSLEDVTQLEAEANAIDASLTARPEIIN